MKILYHHRIASNEGHTVHIEEIIRSFRKLGHEVVCVKSNNKKQKINYNYQKIFNYIRRTIPQTITEWFEISYSLVEFIKIFYLYKKYKPDILYERFNLFSISGIWIKRITNIPYFLEINSPLFEERRNYSGITWEGLARWSQRSSWQAADHALVVTHVLGRIVAKYGVPDARLSVVPNGINQDFFLEPLDPRTAKARLGLEGRFILGFVGFLHPWHGLECVINLLAQVQDPQLCLLVVGDGRCRDELEAHAAKCGVTDQLVITGFVARDAIAEHIAAFDIALQPAVIDYASPLKLFEYMALGRPIVAPNTPNIEEILTDSVDALLFVNGDNVSFCNAITRLRLNDALRERIGHASRQLILERNLTWDGNAQRVITLAELTIASRR